MLHLMPRPPTAPDHSPGLSWELVVENNWLVRAASLSWVRRCSAVSNLESWENGRVGMEHRPAEIARQGRPKLRDAGVVFWQCGETIGCRLIGGVEKFLARLPAA